MTEQPPAAALATTRVDAIADYLGGAGVPYEIVEHPPVLSANAEARAVERSPEEVAKTVVLHDGHTYVIAAIPASRRLDVHKLRALLDTNRQLRLATETEIAGDFPSLEVGAVPPFGPMVPAATVIDSELLRHERILCPAGDHRHSVLVDPQAVVRIAAAQTADICED